MLTMDDEKKNDDDPVAGVDGSDIIYDSSILQIQQAESLVVHRSSSGDNNNNNNRIMDVELDDVQGIDDLHLQALKEYYAICQEHHQHYRSLLLQYQSKVLDLEEVVELSQIKLDSAREKIQRYEHLKRSKKMELIKNQISKVRAEFDLVKYPRQEQEQQQQQQQQVQEVKKQDVEERNGAEIKIETTPSKDDEGDVDNSKQAEKVGVEAAAVAAAFVSPAEASNASQRAFGGPEDCQPPPSPCVIRVKDGVEDLFDHNTDIDIEKQSSLRSEDTLYRVVGSTLSKEDVEVVMKRDKNKQEEDSPAESADVEPAQQEQQEQQEQQQQQENESALVKELKLPSLKPEDAQEASKVSIADETPRARGGSVEAEGRGGKQRQEQKQGEFFQKEEIVDSPPAVKRQVMTLEEEKLTNVVIGRTVSKGDVEPMTTNHSLSSTPSRNKVPASSTPPAMKAASMTPSTRQSKLPKPTPPKSSSSSSDVGDRSSAGTTSAFLKRLQQSRARSASPMRPSEERRHNHHHGVVSIDNTPTGARVDGGKRTTVRVQNPKSQSHPTPQKPRGRAASEDSFGGRRTTGGQSPKTQMYTTPQKVKRATSEELIWSSSPSAASTNVAIPGTPSSASNGGVDANGNLIVMEQTTISVWLRVLSKSSQFHRIRQYIPKSQRAIDDTDVGRQSAVWSFVNGCIMHHDIHEQLYQKFYKSANALAVTRYFNTSRCPPPVNKVTQAKWHSIWEFCKICAGDIVCLLLPHPDPHESLVAFGVVQDHKVVFEKQSNLRIDWNKKKKQQPQQQQPAATNAGPASAGSLSSSAMDKIDFPTAKSIGEYVLLRKIRWYRIAKTRDLPGQTHGTKKDYVDWLTENHPKSISNVTGRGARDFLQSEEFLDCCCSTNNIQHLLHLDEPGEEDVQYIPPISPRLLSTAASLTTAPSPKHQQQKGNNNAF